MFSVFRICSHIRNKVFNTNMLGIPQNADIVNPNLDDFKTHKHLEDVSLNKSAAEITSLVSVSGIVSELGAERQSRTGCCVSFHL